MEQLKQKKINLTEIDDEICGVKISSEQKEKLAFGQYSDLLENLRIDDKTVRDAKLKVTKDKSGKIKVNFYFKSEFLKIPDKILNTNLSEEQKKELLDNKTIGPIVHNNKDIYFKVDNELNKVTVLSANEISIPNQIGNYKVNEADKSILSNNEKLGTRIYQGDDSYFLANVKIRDDKKGIEFTNIKSVSQYDSKKLFEKFNDPNSPDHKQKFEKKIENKKQIDKQQSENKNIKTSVDMITNAFSGM